MSDPREAESGRFATDDGFDRRKVGARIGRDPRWALRRGSRRVRRRLCAGDVKSDISGLRTLTPTHASDSPNYSWGCDRSLGFRDLTNTHLGAATT